MRKLDAGTCEGSAERISSYASALAHELMHANDIRSAGLLNFYTNPYYGAEERGSRHDRIYDAAARIKYEYLGSQ